MNALYKKYRTETVPALLAELRLKNRMQAPRVVKVVLNAGIGRLAKDPHAIENVEKTFLAITGQRAVRTRAKAAISNFKTRVGQEIGVMVTLRGGRMYDFLEKLVKVTFPRIRDFRGLSGQSFDAHGNFAIGFKENLAFPEVKMEEVEKLHGLEVVINTTAKNKEAGQALLSHLGFPFSKQK